MNRAICVAMGLILVGCAQGRFGKASGTAPTGNADTTLRVNSCAVLEDVPVTDAVHCAGNAEEQADRLPSRHQACDRSSCRSEVEQLRCRVHAERG